MAINQFLCLCVAAFHKATPFQIIDQIKEAKISMDGKSGTADEFMLFIQ